MSTLKSNPVSPTVSASSSPTEAIRPTSIEPERRIELATIEFPLSEFQSAAAQQRSAGRTQKPKAVKPEPTVSAAETEMKSQIESLENDRTALRGSLENSTKELSTEREASARLAKLLPPTDTEVNSAREKYSGAIDRATAGRNAVEVAENLHQVATALYVVNDRIQRGENPNRPITHGKLDQVRDYVGGYPEAKGKEDRAVEVNHTIVTRQLAVLERHGIDATKLEAYMTAAAQHAEAEGEKKKGGFWGKARDVAAGVAAGPAGVAAARAAGRAKEQSKSDSSAPVEPGLPAADFLLNPPGQQ